MIFGKQKDAGLHFVNDHPMNGPLPDGFKQVLFGMGCFWGAERIFWQLPGVWITSVGYTAGQSDNPDYQSVCSGTTGHAEVVQVVYDPEKINLAALLTVFWENHNPTQGMRQGNDRGSQYRSGIYTYSGHDLKQAQGSAQEYGVALIRGGYGEITTEIRDASAYYLAEMYHQQYLAKNVDGYCGIGGTGVTCPA